MRRDYRAKSLFRNILPVSLTHSRFCAEFFSAAQWNQDFTSMVGRGYPCYRLPSLARYTGLAEIEIHENHNFHRPSFPDRNRMSRRSRPRCRRRQRERRQRQARSTGPDRRQGRPRRRRRPDRHRGNHRQDFWKPRFCTSRRAQGQAPALHRRRQSQEFHLLRIAQARRRRRSHPQGQGREELRLRRAEFLRRRDDAVKSIVEGAFIGNFDPDYYQSDREDKKIEELVIVAKGDEKITAGRRRSRPHHRRSPEFHPRPGQRTRQPHDAHHPRRPRKSNVRRGRTTV